MLSVHQNHQFTLNFPNRAFYLWNYQVQICCRNHVFMMKMFSNNIYRQFRPCKSPWLCVFCVRARPPSTSASTLANTKPTAISLNSLNRQALTGIDRCSDGGMWMSHVFSIIYTALLFLSPPLRQVSILLRRNQSVICQPLSIRRLIYVSYCGWLHASATSGKRTNVQERHSLQETSFWRLFGRYFFFFFSFRQKSATTESGFIYLFLFLLLPRPRTAVDKVGSLEYFVVDSRTFGVLYHTRGGLRHETFITRRNSAHFSFFSL